MREGEEVVELALEDGGRAKSEEDVGNDGLEDALGIGFQIFGCSSNGKLFCGFTVKTRE
jgi:hypothetical protein